MSEVTDASMIVTGGRGGRPRVAERRVPLAAKVTPRTYDELCKMALRRDETLSSLVARILETKFVQK